MTRPAVKSHVEDPPLETVSLGTRYNCNRSYDGAVSTDWTARRGIAGAYLYSNGNYVARQCHSIS